MWQYMWQDAAVLIALGAAPHSPSFPRKRESRCVYSHLNSVPAEMHRLSILPT